MLAVAVFWPQLSTQDTDEWPTKPLVVTIWSFSEVCLSLVQTLCGCVLYVSPYSPGDVINFLSASPQGPESIFPLKDLVMG